MSRLKRSLKDRDQIVVMTFRWYKIKFNYFNKRERYIYIYIFLIHSNVKLSTLRKLWGK